MKAASVLTKREFFTGSVIAVLTVFLLTARRTRVRVVLPKSPFLFIFKSPAGKRVVHSATTACAQHGG